MAEVLAFGQSQGYVNTAVGTSPVYVDLTPYAGCYVKVQFLGEDGELAWGAADAFSVQTGDTGGTIDTPGVPERVTDSEQGVHRLVPPRTPWAAIFTVSGTTTVRIFPTSQKVT